MLQVGAQETDLKTESHVQMVYLGVLSGLCLEGSQKKHNWPGGEVKL